MKFELNLSIKKCAEVHCGKKWILKMDIKKFYDSVSEKQIKKAIAHFFDDLTLPARNLIGINGNNDIYHKITLDNKLVTGICTSAHIANYIIQDAEREIKAFCKEQNITYSRYMDDMNFSSDDKKLLNQAEEKVKTILSNYGFTINQDKIHYVSDNKRQEILGLVVNNKKSTLEIDIKRKYRSMIYNYIKAISLEKEMDIKESLRKINAQHILGYLSFVKCVDKEFYERLCKYFLLLVEKFNLIDNEELKKTSKILKPKKH